MFGIITKEQLWEYWDRGLNRKFPQGHGFHLKTIQDLAVFSIIGDSADLEIAEVGGGDSRLLHNLSSRNKCTNIEKFEGADGGPSDEIIIENVRNVHAFLGEHSDQIRPNEFDILYSISVVEHVPSETLDSFLSDGLRCLKPGGLFVHAIDLYLEDDPSDYFKARYDTYKSWLNQLDPIGEIDDKPLKFSTAMATNPDTTMYSWGKRAPLHAELRKRAQSVSAIIAGRKPL